MNKRIVIGIVGITVFVGTAYYLVASNSPKQIGQTMTYEETAPENTSTEEGAHSIQATNNAAAERAFIEHMIPHHQEAVDTSKQVVALGSNAEAKKVAQDIITAQEKEIADMKSWYTSWYGKEYVANDTYTTMMRDLSSLSGVELDKAFLEDMIAHHTAALQQAQIVAPVAQHPETLTLAQTIAETQSNEIITMRIILKQL